MANQVVKNWLDRANTEQIAGFVKSKLSLN